MARALIVEDCAKTRRLLMLILAVNGHDVVMAADGYEGLRALDAKACTYAPFDIVITEIILPRHDGFEIIRAGARLPQRPKILVIDHPFTPATLGMQPDYLRMALELGADRALANPIPVDAFEEAVAILLNEDTTGIPLRRAG